MPIRAGSQSFILALSLLGVLIVPTMAQAQAGFYVTPSFSLAEVYDDNLFSTSSRLKPEKDVISRFSPGLQAGYQSTPLTLLGRYTFDAEVFANHPELTGAQTRQQASIESQYLPTQWLKLAFTSEYVETPTPRELNKQTGLEGGRVRAQRYSFSPSIAYGFDAFTAGTGGYTFTKDEQSGGVATDTHTANLGLDRRITPWDTGSLGYIFRRFFFDSRDTTTSHAFAVGWTRQLTSLTSIALQAGPRFSEGSVDPEVSASIRHRLKQGDLSFTYSRSQNTISGRAGTVNTESFTGAVTYQLLPFLQVGAEPRFSRNTGAASEAKVYEVSLNATYQINKWLSLLGSFQSSIQQGSLDSVTATSELGDEDIHHNILLLSVAITNPYRVY